MIPISVSREFPGILVSDFPPLLHWKIPLSFPSPKTGMHFLIRVSKVLPAHPCIQFLNHDGDNIYVCFWAIGEMMGVIEMVVDKQDDRDVHNVGKVVTKEWRKAKRAENGIWASGNV